MIKFKDRKYVLAEKEIHLTLDDLLDAAWRVDSNSIYDETTEEVEVDEFLETNINGVKIAVQFGGRLENIFCDEYMGVNSHGSLEKPGTLEIEQVVTDRPVVVHFRDESALLNENAPDWALDDVFAEFAWFGRGLPKGGLEAQIYKELDCHKQVEEDKYADYIIDQKRYNRPGR